MIYVVGWKEIFQGRKIITAGVRWRVGDERHIRVKHDPYDCLCPELLSLFRVMMRCQKEWWSYLIEESEDGEQMLLIDALKWMNTHNLEHATN